MFGWFLSQCNDCESKAEYDRSHIELSLFLRLPETAKVLSNACVEAIKSLQFSLQTREYKLAGYNRHEIKNCMDSSTTSPVESQNNTIKHGPNPVKSTMNLNKASSRLMTGIINRLRRRQNHAHQELAVVSNASRSPTRNYLIKKGQSLIDCHYDKRKHYRSAQLHDDTWLVWNFDDFSMEHMSHEQQLYQPKFMRVRELRLVSDDENQCFVECTCHVRTRVGVPCTCFFSISSNAGIDEKYIVDVGMVDVRYLKQFHAHWGEDSELGRTLHAAQQQCFVNEGCGVPISEDFANELMGEPGQCYPVLGKNTTESEFEEALFVRGCDTCTRFDLEMNRLNENEPGWDDDFILNDLKEGKKHDTTVLSRVGKSYQDGINAGANESVRTDKTNTDFQLTEDERHDLYKSMNDRFSRLLHDERADVPSLRNLVDEVHKCMDTHCELVNMNEGETVGCDGDFREFGHTSGEKKHKKRYCGSMH